MQIFGTNYKKGSLSCSWLHQVNFAVLKNTLFFTLLLDSLQLKDSIHALFLLYLFPEHVEKGIALAWGNLEANGGLGPWQIGDGRQFDPLVAEGAFVEAGFVVVGGEEDEVGVIVDSYQVPWIVDEVPGAGLTRPEVISCSSEKMKFWSMTANCVLLGIHSSSWYLPLAKVTRTISFLRSSSW